MCFLTCLPLGEEQVLHHTSLDQDCLYTLRVTTAKACLHADLLVIIKFEKLNETILHILRFPSNFNLVRITRDEPLLQVTIAFHIHARPKIRAQMKSAVGKDSHHAQTFPTL